MTKSGQYQGSSGHQYSRSTGHHDHQSKGPHKGKKTAGKRRLNYGGTGGGGPGGRNGGHASTFGNKTAKENAFKAGYRKAAGKPAATKPFMMDGEVVPKLDQK